MLLALLVAYAAGWGTAIRWRAGRDAVEAVAQSETHRETERLAARKTARIADELTSNRLAADRAADAAGQRLRLLAQSARANRPAACTDGNADTGPAAGVLRDADRDDLVALAREADAVADRLRACQELVDTMQAR